MVCALEKDFLEDKFIDCNFISNININDRIKFSNKNIYYFGNYNNDKINIIKRKLLKNKKKIINSIENGIKIIITGNSCELFNMSFKHDNSLNLFNCDNNIIKKKILSKHNTIKNNKDYNVKKINVLNNHIYGNFTYKNLYFINNEKYINKIIKKQSN